MTILNRFRHDTLAVFIAGGVVATVSLASSPGELDLQEALSLAGRNNKLLEAARIRIEEARGDLATASILLIDNPSVGFQGGRRSNDMPASRDSTDLGIELEQTFEIGGQRGYRIRRAEAVLAAEEAAADEVQRVLELAVESVFWEALAADKRVALVEESRSLSQVLYETARRRLERGETTPLEQNTARVRLAEVERKLASANARRRSATLRLAELLALPPATSLAVRDDFPQTETLESESALVAQALASRPDFMTLQRRIAAAEQAAGLAKAETVPDLTFGVSYEEEEDDQILLAGVRVALPVFNRNQGERQRTEALVRRLQAELDATTLAIESEVRRAYSDYEQAKQSVHLYDSEVLQAQEESLGLLQMAFEAGEVGYPEVILVQREVLDSREGYLSARLEFALAHARLRAASQQPQVNAEQE